MVSFETCWCVVDHLLMIIVSSLSQSESSCNCGRSLKHQAIISRANMQPTTSILTRGLPQRSCHFSEQKPSPSFISPLKFHPHTPCRMEMLRSRRMPHVVAKRPGARIFPFPGEMS